MNIARFFRRPISLVTDLDTNSKVQKFANDHCVEHSRILIQVNGSKYDNSDRLVTVQFTPNQKHKEIVELITREFKYYSLDNGGLMVLAK